MAAKKKASKKKAAKKRATRPAPEPQLGDATYVGQLMKRYFARREERLALEREVKDLKTMEKVLAESLSESLSHDELTQYKGEFGTFSRKKTSVFQPDDWDKLFRFSVEQNYPEMFQKRIHAENLNDFLEEHPEFRAKGIPGGQFVDVWKTSASAAKK